MEAVEHSKKYLLELQRFLDIAENIQEEKLKKEIINQMFKCTESLIESEKKEKGREKNG